MTDAARWRAFSLETLSQHQLEIQNHEVMLRTDQRPSDLPRRSWLFADWLSFQITLSLLHSSIGALRFLSTNFSRAIIPVATVKLAARASTTTVMMDSKMDRSSNQPGAPPAAK
jgi:hypothetical protein